MDSPMGCLRLGGSPMGLHRLRRETESNRYERITLQCTLELSTFRGSSPRPHSSHAVGVSMFLSGSLGQHCMTSRVTITEPEGFSTRAISRGWLDAGPR